MVRSGMEFQPESLSRAINSKRTGNQRNLKNRSGTAAAYDQGGNEVWRHEGSLLDVYGLAQAYEANHPDARVVLIGHRDAFGSG